MTVSALNITDPENDVDHIIIDPSSSEQVSDKPNLDVTKVSYTIQDETVTLSIAVKGVIEDATSIKYYAEYECSDAAYQFTYNNGNLVSRSSSVSGGDKTYIGEATGHTIEPSNTLSVTFDLVGAGGTDGELYGFAGDHFGELGVNEYWVDNTEDINDGGSGNGGNNGNSPPSGTPGFEALTVILALGIGFIILKRRK